VIVVMVLVASWKLTNHLTTKLKHCSNMWIALMALFFNESFCACKCLQCDSILFQVMSQANFLPKVLSFIDIRLCLQGHLHWQSLRFCVFFWVRKLASPTRAVSQQIGLFMANRSKYGPSFQLYSWPFVFPALMLRQSKTDHLKVESSA
jgi:hypothetical protein